MQTSSGLHIQARALELKLIQTGRPVLKVPPVSAQLRSQAEWSIQRNRVGQSPEAIKTQLRLPPVTIELKSQIAVLIQFLQISLQVEGTVETYAASEGSSVGPVVPATVHDPENVPTTTDAQLRRLEPVLH